MDFLQLTNRSVLVFGLANRKSVAYHVGRVLSEAGADVLYAVHSDERRDSVRKLVGDAPVYVCDVGDQSQIDRLRDEVARDRDQLAGIVHSIAFADYSAGWLPFNETPRPAFLQAVDISCYSLIAISNAFRELLNHEQGSVVTISISTTRMAAENYGYMAPIKAALDSTVAFLAKSFSEFSRVRFNAVCPGLLKTASSAGIPGVRGLLPVCRTGHAAKTGRADRRGRQRGRLHAQPALVGDERTGAGHRCGDGGELLRSRNCGPGDGDGGAKQPGGFMKRGDTPGLSRFQAPARDRSAPGDWISSHMRIGSTISPCTSVSR